VTSDSDPELTGSDDPVAALLQELSEEEGHRSSERRSVMIAAVALLGVAVVYLVESFSYRLGTAAQPGPGLFPVVIGAGFVAASIGLLVETLRSSRERQVVWPYASGAIRLAAVVASSAAYVALVPVVGQLLSSTLLCVVLLWSLRVTRWWLVLGFALAFSAGSQYLFGTILNVPFPRGLFGF
jgi:hypothetical protein